MTMLNSVNSFSCIENIRTVGYSDHHNVEVVLDSGADGSVLPLAYGDVGYADESFDGSKFIDAQGKPIQVKSVRIAEVKFGSVVFRERFHYSCSYFTLDFHGQTAERWLAPSDQ